jgi:flagellar hook protein FlgE
VLVTRSFYASFGKYVVRQNQTDSVIREELNNYGDGACLNLAIMGNGYFVVRDPETNEFRATQVGHFDFDEDGHLLTVCGARLQGRTGGDLSPMGDLQINAAGLPAGSIPRSTMLCYTIDDWGKISVQLSDGSNFLCGQVMLQNFQYPQALINEGNDHYSNLSNASPLPALAAPGTNGLGTIESSVLELSVAERTSLLR